MEQTRLIDPSAVRTDTGKAAGMRRGDVTAFIAAFLIAGAAFALLLSPHYSADDLQYANVIREALGGRPAFHPAGLRLPNPVDASPEVDRLTAPWPLNVRYLLEWPTSAAAARLMRAMGFQHDPLYYILTLRVLAGALGVGLFALTLRFAGLGTGATAIATIGLGSSVAYSTYSTHADQTINTVVCVCAALAALTYTARRGRTPLVPLIVPLVLAALYNLTAVLAAAGVLFGAIIRSTTGATRWRQLVRAMTVFGISVVGVLGFTLLVAAGPQRPREAAFWNEVFFQGHGAREFSPAQDLVRAATGLVKSAVEYPGLGDSAREFIAAASTTNRVMFVALALMTLGAIVFVPASLLIRRIEHELHAVLALTGMALFAIFAVFNWWWEPSYIKYWVVPLVGWWCTAAVFVELELSHKLSITRLQTTWPIAVMAIWVVLNVRAQTVEARTPNEWLSAAERLRSTPPQSLFISAGHPLDFYLTYFAERDVIAPRLVAYGNSEDSGRVVSMLCRQLQAHVQLGGPVYAYGDYSQPSLGSAKAFELIRGLDWQPASSPGLSIRQTRLLSVPQACLVADTSHEPSTR